MSKVLLWCVWSSASAVGAVVLTCALPTKDSVKYTSQTYLPGETTSGHYQIELKCVACHEPGGGVREQSCLDCHAEELKASRDTHPKTKFADPAKAKLLESVSAQSCVTCHKKHVPEQTHAMGITLPLDYCWHCHQSIAEDRPSHAGLEFQSCATAGCHNYHDNTPLYENYLWKHIGEADVLEDPTVPVRSFAPDEKSALTQDDPDAPAEVDANPNLLAEWLASQHARAGVNCSHCHQAEPGKKTHASAWHDHVDHQICQNCHGSEVKGFLESRHGMRLAAGLSPMQPSWARLPMHGDANHKQLDCQACHASHEYDTRKAAVEACLSCHNDEHTNAYQQSKHYELWLSELRGESPPGSGVSCATCHFPRTTVGSKVTVDHNQNANLHPSRKWREACARTATACNSPWMPCVIRK